MERGLRIVVDEELVEMCLKALVTFRRFSGDLLRNVW